MLKTESSQSSWRVWSWVPSLYFCEAIPYVAVVALSVVMYKRLGVSNAEMAFYTSWLYLPWVIKPLWSPLLERFRTKRFWIVSLQFFIGAGLAAIALTIPGPDFFKWTLAAFWLMAFSSATHDIAADGFYMLALPPHQQAAFVGVRSLFYRLANIAGQGGLVYLAGHLEETTGNITTAWSWVFVPPALLFAIAATYHFLVLPRPVEDRPSRVATNAAADWVLVFAEFFRKREIVQAMLFLLLYRLGEAQLVKLAQPFLLDARDVGGLGLSTKDVGLAYGTYGIIALTVGGLLGGWAISRRGLRAMLWPMLICMHVPNLAYVLLAWLQPDSFLLACGAVVLEQLGYGFGFTAYLVFMMLVATGEHKTAHYAICTGFMALGMMLPGMVAGGIQELLGYSNFFIWVCVATQPSVVAVALLKIDPAFGRKA
ncbi:MAG TPA: AmpG family muropeptide MFS transporter [Opitutaceae bacterium]|nr:AmpG family muropeptide MFS transporter [Opitutaceae bacterium]